MVRRAARTLKAGQGDAAVADFQKILDVSDRIR
jgi:hypothetical protein